MPLIQTTGEGWLEEHLEGFIRPHLGSIPNVDMKANSIGVWTPMMIRCLHAVWKRAKELAEDRMILLPGRDVWLLEVLARMEGWPTLFRKEISSAVAGSGLLTDDFSTFHCIDTGYGGSVPKKLKIPNWHLINWSGAVGCTNYPSYGVSCLSVREQGKRKSPHQIYPYVQPGKLHPKTGQTITKGSPICAIAGHLEGTPKYWERGDVEYEAPSTTSKIKSIVGAYVAPKPARIKPQKLEHNVESFKTAAMITRLIAESYITRRKVCLTTDPPIKATAATATFEFPWNPPRPPIPPLG